MKISNKAYFETLEGFEKAQNVATVLKDITIIVALVLGCVGLWSLL